ncbi:MAG TPA: histidinol-phosphate transaminase [Legionellaceae bacterium]|nr:histidinol-phosphate transaminase [Legionellaceae bacterium]
MDYDFSSLPHKGIQALSPYVPGKSVEEVANECGIHDIIKLASNENAYGCSPKVIEALQEITPMMISRYPSAAHHPIRKQLSEFLGIEANMLTIANGSDSLFGLLLTCFALHQNKHILTHEYAFSSYEIQARSLGIKVKKTPTQNWQIDISALIKACTDKTALIFIANPNNPTGLMINMADICQILDNIPKSTLLILDEAYFEFVNPCLHTVQLLHHYPNLVITRTFSKAYGLAGLRLGYALAHPQITRLIQKIHLPFTANVVAMHAACAALSDQPFIQKTQSKIEAHRYTMMGQLDEQHIDYIPSYANFLAIDCGQDTLPIVQALQAHGIIVRPLHPYGMDTYLRVTIGTKKQNERFLKTFFDILAQGK